MTSIGPWPTTHAWLRPHRSAFVATRIGQPGVIQLHADEGVRDLSGQERM